jgi:hypothetical protein
MAPQRDSQKEDNEVDEMVMQSTPTVRRSRRVTFAPGTKEMSNITTPVSTPSKKRNTWNPAKGWKIDPSLKLSFDVVSLYKGPRLGELASYANSYYQQKKRLSTTNSSIFQTDGMKATVLETCPLSRSHGSSPRIQSEKLSHLDTASCNDMDAFPLPRMNGSPRMRSEKFSDSDDAVSRSNDIDSYPLPCMQDMNGPRKTQSEKLVGYDTATTMDIGSYPLPRMNGSPRMQSEKLSDAEATSSSSPLKHRRTCRSNLPSTDDILLLNRSSTTMDTENQNPTYNNNNSHNEDKRLMLPNNASLLYNMSSKEKQPDIRSCFDQTMRSKPPSSSSKCGVSQAMMSVGTSSKINSTCFTATTPTSSIPTQIVSMIATFIPPQKHDIVEDDTVSLLNSFSLSFPGRATVRRKRPTILAFQCFLCFFCAFLFSICFNY